MTDHESLFDWQSLLELQARLAAIQDVEALVQSILHETTSATGSPRAVLLFADDVGSPEPILRPMGISGYSPASLLPMREALALGAAGSDDAALAAWNALQPYDTQQGGALRTLSSVLSMEAWYSLPLRVRGHLAGALIVETPAPLAPPARDWLRMMAPGFAASLYSARMYTAAANNLNARINELAILQRIDLELSEQITPDHVFDMTLDWAMRYTGSHFGSIAVFDEFSDGLRFVAEIGYDGTAFGRAEIRATYDGGIPWRVAHAGRPDVIPDVRDDPGFAPVATEVRSHLSVPVMKEDRVIAVITVESRRLNHYSDDHVTFVERLAARAGNAMDNARLFDQTVAEREKLSNIVSNIADVVLVVDADDHLALINQSALPALRLYADGRYQGMPIEDLLADSALLDVYRRFRQHEQTVTEEVLMPNGRTFNAHLSAHSNIGTILVLQDITALKQTDQLKNELIATVSHDLKQPLTVIGGYLELLQMTVSLEGRPLDYVLSAQRSIASMRNLIDDLLNLARIEAGIPLELISLNLSDVLSQSIDAARTLAAAKEISLNLILGAEPIAVTADMTASLQIFTNLVSNAVKYTPHGGTVTVSTERRGDTVLVTVDDTGIGISPEDQARIFDRFYRVRRPETDQIDGTGMGLAIVKRLIELNHGQIGVESRLGEGSRFIVALPAASAALSAEIDDVYPLIGIG